MGDVSAIKAHNTTKKSLNEHRKKQSLMIHGLSSQARWVCRSHVWMRSNVIKYNILKSPPLLPYHVRAEIPLLFCQRGPLRTIQKHTFWFTASKDKDQQGCYSNLSDTSLFLLHRSQIIFFQLSAQRTRETVVQNSRRAGADMQVPFCWQAVIKITNSCAVS